MCAFIKIACISENRVFFASRVDRALVTQNLHTEKCMSPTIPILSLKQNYEIQNLKVS